MIQIVDEANKLLAYLAQNADPNWTEVLDLVLNEEDYETNVKNVHAMLDEIGLPFPLGAVKGGTGSLKAAAGVESQDAVRLLKKHKRIVQAGSGRGKAVCVLNETPLPNENVGEPVVELHGNVVDANDIAGLISALALASFNRDNRIKELEKQLSLSETSVEKLKVELEAERQVNLLNTTNITWS